MIELTLKAVIDIIKSLITDSAKNKIKGKSSEEKAKKAALNLYSSLTELQAFTKIFISTIERISKNQIESGHNNNLVSSQESREISQSLGTLLSKLNLMARHLNEINPQLEIRENKLVREIQEYSNFRSGLIREIEKLLDLQRMNYRKLETLAKKAEKNAIILDQAILQYRSFIASQFDFKQSFL